MKDYKRDWLSNSIVPATCVRVEEYLKDPVANEFARELGNCEQNYNYSSFGRMKPTNAGETVAGETIDNYPGVGSWGAECYCPIQVDGENWIASDGDERNE